MIIKDARFIGSFTTNSQCPTPDKPEFAFIGRSNVGKSTLINLITNHKYLAKISGTPGKTQTINHFLINDDWYLVDLPGYGYAKVSKTSRAKWEKMIRSYLLNRSNLQCVFVLIDSRLTPQKLDLEFIDKLGEMRVPFILIFTKADKITQREVHENIKVFKTEMLKTWDAVPDIIITSSVKKTGREELLEFIENVLVDVQGRLES